MLGLLVCGFIVFQLGGISKVIHKIQGKHMIIKMDNRRSLFSSSPKSINSIIFLGDSITEYGEWSELFPKHQVLNRGIAGEGIHGVLHRLDEVKRHDPRIIFLMIGVNDLCYHQPEKVIDAYFNLLDTMLKNFRNTQIVVQSILPVNNNLLGTGTNNKAIDQVNAALAHHCGSLGLEYINLNHHFKDENQNLKETFTSDGIHINGIAYNTWKQVINPWISER